ncbi:MAG: MFS transporter [Thermoplasmata archaeon]|nr:MFS transporter [Thermoplasmata archaeon]
MLASATERPEGEVPLLQRRGFVLLFSAGLVSGVGFAVAEICLVWIIFATTHSAWDIALYGLSGALAAVAFSLVGGALTDRYDRRRLMILSDYVRSAAIAALLVILWEWGFVLAAVLASNVVFAAFATIFGPAEQTYLPTVVGEEKLAQANGWVSSSRSAALFVGSALGGALIVAVGPLLGLLLDAGTLAVSGSLIFLLPASPPRVASLPRLVRGVRGFLTEIGGGIDWLASNLAWLELTVSAGFFNFFSAMTNTFLVVFASVLLHGNALVFGSLLAAIVAGQGTGALLVGRSGALRYAGWAWLLPYGVVSGLLLLALALVPVWPFALAMIALLGLAQGFSGTTWLTAAQLMVPKEIQGRYFGIDSLGSWMIIPLAQIAGGVLVGSVGIGTTYLIAGITWTLTGVLFILPSSLRRLRYRAPNPVVPGA